MPRLALILAFSLLALWVHRSHGLPLHPQPFALIGISLAVFMGFRNNAAYDRYWEGRKLWGLLLIEARTLTRQALTLPRPACSEAEVQALCALLAAFAHTLRHQLRGTEPHHALQRLLPAPLAQRLRDAPQRPALLLLELGRWAAGSLHAAARGRSTITAYWPSTRVWRACRKCWAAASALPPRPCRSPIR
jgi:putative membrane protein